VAEIELEVLLFAGLRARAGESVVVRLAAPATVADLRAALAAQYPTLGTAEQLAQVRFAVDQEFAEDETEIPRSVEIAAIPPVSGGHDGDRPATLVEPVDGSHSRLSPLPLDPEAVVAAVSHDGAGGITSFTGQVRVHSRDQVIERLEYEAYAPMAVRVMDAIASEIEAETGAQVRIHHRVGTLKVGEIAVVIAASAAHRAEAFDACRAAIERLKQDVPIWKKEVSTTGQAWIGQGP
jgi:molybdopterin synthase catalytic subunit